MKLFHLILVAGLTFAVAGIAPADAANPFKKTPAKEQSIKSTYKTKKAELKRSKSSHKADMNKAGKRVKEAANKEYKAAMLKAKAKRALYDHKLRLENTLRKSGFTQKTLQEAVGAKKPIPDNVKFEYNKYMHRDAVYQKRVKKTYDEAKKTLDQANTDFYDARGKYEKAHSGLVDLKAQKKKDLKAARKLVKEPIIYEELPVAPQQTNSTRYSNRRDFPFAAKTGTATFPIYDVVPPLAE